MCEGRLCLKFVKRAEIDVRHWGPSAPGGRAGSGSFVETGSHQYPDLYPAGYSTRFSADPAPRGISEPASAYVYVLKCECMYCMYSGVLYRHICTVHIMCICIPQNAYVCMCMYCMYMYVCSKSYIFHTYKYSIYIHIHTHTYYTYYTYQYI